MHRATPRLAATLAAALTLLALAGCTSSGGGEGPGADPHDSVGGGQERVFRDPAELGRPWPGGPVLSPATVAPVVREQVEAFEEAWGVELTGDWTPESIALLERTLVTYGDSRSVFENLKAIHMTEIGTIGEYSNDVAGMFQPHTCNSADKRDCLDIEKANPTTGDILL